MCSNCYNGCSDITSDKCVKYTGIDVPSLGIETGDTLLTVENAIITYLLTVMDGTGIILDISDDDYCTLVSQYLSDPEEVTALDLFTALVKAACDLQTQIDAVVSDVAVIEADYDVDCLAGVSAGDGTHDILQAVITKLCEIDTDLTALALDLSTNYVKLADLNELIQAYLDEQEVTDKAYAKMIPYAAVEYYGPISNYPNTGDSFDASGAGLNYWEKVYLCNGDNGTPDKRGRVAVGATSTPGVLPMDPEVDPGSSAFNPAYTLSAIAGENEIILDVTQIPVHTHTVVVTDPGHYTNIKVNAADGNDWDQVGGSGQPIVGVENRIYNTHLAAEVATTTTLDLTGVSVVNNDTGGGLGHSNVQPGIGAYYIMYIP